MASQLEGNNISDIIKYEAGFDFSREVKTLALNQTVSLGEVLEPDSDNVKVLATAANATCVALEAVTTGAVDTAKILCAVRHCILVRENLTYNSEDEDDTDAILAALGIVVRENFIHDES